jgi:hypothetical protein
MDEKNQFNKLTMRVVLSVNPKDDIKHPSELLPSEKILEDYDNLDTTTEMITMQNNRLSSCNTYIFN